MRYLFTTIILLIIITLSSCRKDFDTELSTGNLTFSKDTIFFNRVFDDISSSTRRFTVRNSSNNDITIPTISLERGETSFYRLNVDGIAGKSFNNIDILAKDSIFVFVEATINFDDVDAEFMYRDNVLFDAGANEQKVELEALVLDVNLIRPDRTELDGEDGFVFEEIILGQTIDPDNPPNLIDVTVIGTNLDDDELHWTNQKPYLIYNFVGVPAGKTLTIDAGTQIHFHANSGIVVLGDGKLIVNGTLDNQVVFQGDRLEEPFEDVPGQWATIWLLNGSKNSIIENAIIKNATLGLLIDSNNSITEETLIANNLQIYNTTSYGILGREAKITAKNLVVGNNGLSSFGTILGGTYNFIHTTFGNYWRNSNRQTPTVFLTNLGQDAGGNIIEKDLIANFTNCIIDGNQNIEIGLEKGESGNAFDFKFKNCLLKFDDVSNQFTDDPLYNMTDVSLYENVLLNQNADFKNTNANDGATDLRIGDDSVANGMADFTIIGTDLILQKDIIGTDRIAPTDIGAYNHITFEEDED